MSRSKGDGYIRQLESGLWAATIRTPAGRITESFDRERQAKAWASDEMSKIRSGEWIDPRKAKKLVGTWWEECLGGRHLELASRLRDASHWRCHVGPRWARTELGAVKRKDVNAWVVEMTAAKVGAATIEGAVGVLRSLLDLAVEDEILSVNHARNIRKPKRDAHVDRILGFEEEVDLLAALDRVAPGRVDARLFCELILDTGMRWEEVAALPPQMIDLRRRRIHIAWVMERNGTVRPYAKSNAGNRTVTYSDALDARLAAARKAARAVTGVFPKDEPGMLVFTGSTGKALNYSNWNQRVWSAALHGRRAIGKVRGHAPREAIPGAGLEDPQPTCHDLRHTLGTRLADAGVPVHDLMALLGHGDIRSSQRYLHSGEARFERAREALKKVRQAG
jgi:site-specific recombinase XerD